ncbi:MAG: calcium/proton exchanger [Gluconacetobacter diazotrophicus]|nr:calcium/proton exchanger [Gluconacetobacter diazotrophicus]
MLASFRPGVLLLLLVPVAPVLQWGVHAPAFAVFLAGALGVAVLADWVRKATEQMADRTGPAIGGLLNVSFGSIAELVLALFVLRGGHAEVVRAQLTGSILATTLFGLGLAALVGGLGREQQRFGRKRAGMLSSMLILAVITLVLPAVVELAGRHAGAGGAALRVSDEHLSLGVSSVVLALYAINTVYTLVFRRNALSEGEAEGGGQAHWSVARALAVLVGATVLIALESELVSDALAETAESLHLSGVFLGVVVLAVVGTAADLFAATVFARQDRMGLVVGICLGSAIQVALVIAPLLVILSWAIGAPMTLVFRNPLDLFALGATVLIANAVAGDGETNWFEGVLLIGVYVLLGLAYFFVAPAA